MAPDKWALIVGSIVALIGVIIEIVKLFLQLIDRKKQQEQEKEKAAPESSQD